MSTSWTIWPCFANALPTFSSMCSFSLSLSYRLKPVAGIDNDSSRRWICADRSVWAQWRVVVVAVELLA
ncbi:hypothetical protein GUJ93_ZPchr0011g27477 [Zizania palustris]|uniref:Uncharacterized protein n=1 Tax=Zizania palustris TaxID=103762 RepID=A0A8J5WGT0_ZIZPA|nr:hypothetical protein GUJ93_ZPchr0011g27477 [Zizania palustris]